MREQGRNADAELYYERALEFLDLSDEADKERQNITADDTFMAHDLSADLLKQAKDELRRHNRLEKAYLVRKSVRFLPEKAAYVLGIVPTRAWYQFSKNDDDALLLSSIAQETPLPAGTYVILLNQNKKLKAKMESVAGAKIYG
jgi:hypothetical protein